MIEGDAAVHPAESMDPRGSARRHSHPSGTDPLDFHTRAAVGAAGRAHEQRWLELEIAAGQVDPGIGATRRWS